MPREPARAETCPARPGIIPVARQWTGASSRGEAFSKCEMNVQRELQTHAQTCIIEVITGDITDGVEPVEYGVAMDAEAFRGFLRAPVRREKRVQGADQIGIVLSIVGEQFAERLRVEV